MIPYRRVAAATLVAALSIIPLSRAYAEADGESLVNALNGLKNLDTGGITPPISYGPGNHDPLKCLQWLHNTNGQWRTTSGWNCF